ncbi:unnamed protein product [Diatraea saccharalis]|uniref:DUF4806 domain-containing protein n=1 Tax=Diatraea saccharalis TaxID=40085 RepID=A0A9N9RG28_9NEOP|nr:unnamed protein product [Diatraea saccharalis]
MQQVNHLSYIGGNKPPAIVKRILEKVFTDNLAVNCNWTGKNKKTSPKDLRIVKIIKELDSFSTFPFENFMCKIKRLLRSHNMPLEKIAKWLGEKAADKKFDNNPHQDAQDYETYCSVPHKRQGHWAKLRIYSL